MSDMPWSWLSPFSQTFDKFVNNPVTNWGRFFNPQMIFNYNPEDAPIEAHVLSKVGSYGSQISTLLDMVAVLPAACQIMRPGYAPTRAESSKVT